MFYRAVEKTINDQFLEVSGLFTDHLSRIVEAGDQEFVRVQAIQTHLQKTSDFLVQVGQKINSNIERKVDGIIDKSHRTVVEAEVNELISKQKYGEAVERVVKDPELLVITLKAFNIDTFLESGVLTSSDLMEVARSLSLGIQLVDDTPIALDWLKAIETKLKFGFSDNHICLEIITNLENYSGANLDAISEIRDKFLAKQIQ